MTRAGLTLRAGEALLFAVAALFMALWSPAALSRVARLADGWNLVGIPVEGMA
jgi:hypothetical protein